MRECILILGSNLGDRKSNIERALAQIEKEIGTILKQTEFLETEPVEFVSSNIFCNIAASILTGMSPMEVLKSVKKIEREIGRVMDSSMLEKYEDRVIDIDIVRFENLLFKCERLNIPHFRHLYERDFSKKIIGELKKLNI